MRIIKISLLTFLGTFGLLTIGGATQDELLLKQINPKAPLSPHYLEHSSSENGERKHMSPASPNQLEKNRDLVNEEIKRISGYRTALEKAYGSSRVKDLQSNSDFKEYNERITALEALLRGLKTFTSEHEVKSKIAEIQEHYHPEDADHY